MPDTNLFPEISIIMPTHNRSGFILETIESISNQTYKYWELIIIDDGSDDDTEAIVLKLRDERIRYYRIERIGMISKVRKLGIEKASGEFIAFIDSDDLWAATKLEEQINALQQNEEVEFCLLGGYNFRDKGKAIDYFYEQQEGTKKGDLFISFFQSALACYLQALMFRKKCLEISPFLKTDNDVDFILRLAKNFPGIIIYKPLLFRRIHETNFSNSNWEKSYAKGIKLIQANKENVQGEIIKNAFFRLYINYGEDCLKNKERKKALENFFIAWKNKPLSFVPFKKSGKLLLQYFKK